MDDACAFGFVQNGPWFSETDLKVFKHCPEVLTAWAQKLSFGCTKNAFKTMAVYVIIDWGLPKMYISRMWTQQVDTKSPHCV